jgi:sensor histidine kinase YesM
MDNNSLLRGLSSLFSGITLSCFLYTLVFLFSFYALRKYTIRININKWLNHILTAWLAVMAVFAVVRLVENLAGFIRHERFGAGPDFHIHLGEPMFILLSPLASALLFTVYLWASSIWKRSVKGIVKIMLIEGLFIFIITMGSMLIVQISFQGFKDILLSLSIWVPGPTGCALAFMAYNYYLYHNRLKIREKELQISRLQQQLSQSQLDALSSKINPHFLYNALNSIAGLATSDGVKTRAMAIALSKLFRYNINKEESSYVRVSEELEMVLTYLEIEKIRFDERLGYSYNVPRELEDELIPRHLLQPLVENAVKHGGSADNLEINITLKKNEKEIMITVSDNGRPFDEDFSPGYGIKSLYDKLDLLTSGRYEIAFENNPKQVCITIGEHKKLLS